MKNLNWTYIIVALIVLGGWFYWFQWRPMKIRQYCFQHAEKNAKVYSQSLGEFTEAKSVFDRSYEKCLKEKGLE